MFGYRYLHVLLIGVCCVGAVTSATANTIDSLVGQLASDNETARVHARQLLPREGAEAIPALLPLINHDNESVWRAAYNVLADIANEACAPGHEADRLKATAGLCKLIALDQTPRAQEYGLRLIRFIIPPGYSVDAIVPFLKNSMLREYARGTLEVAATEEAARALEAAIPGSPSEFQMALIRSLEKVDSPGSLSVLTGLMNDEDFQVAVAAARAAAQAAEPEQAPVFRRIRENAPTDLRFDATDTLLCYADALARSGGNWALAMGIYDDVLNSTEDPVLTATAMKGLGRYGDATVVKRLIAKAASSEQPAVNAALPLALASLRGREAADAMAAAYPDVPGDLKANVLRALGGANSPDIVALIGRELGNRDETVREAALAVAGRLKAPELLEPLTQRVESSEGGERDAALDAALSIASGSGHGDEGKASGPALAKLYGYAQDDALRGKILGSIEKSPSVEALPVAMDALDTPALADEAVRVLMALLKPLVDEGKRDEARTVFSVVMEKNSSPEAIVAMASRMGSMASEVGLDDMLGAVHDWHIIGPFAWSDDADWEKAFVGEPNVDVTANIAADGKTLAWKTFHTADTFGTVNLLVELGSVNNAFAYAYTTFEVGEDRPGELRMGSDDGVVAWVNGEKVWENRVDRGMSVDSDIAPIQLKKGTNTVLLKISQGGGGWSFCCRVTDNAGMGIPRGK